MSLEFSWRFLNMYGFLIYLEWKNYRLLGSIRSLRETITPLFDCTER